MRMSIRLLVVMLALSVVLCGGTGLIVSAQDAPRKTENELFKEVQDLFVQVFKLRELIQQQHDPEQVIKLQEQVVDLFEKALQVSKQVNNEKLQIGLLGQLAVAHSHVVMGADKENRLLRAVELFDKAQGPVVTAEVNLWKAAGTPGVKKAQETAEAARKTSAEASHRIENLEKHALASHRYFREMGASARRVYAPYDGGINKMLIFESELSQAEAKAKAREVELLVARIRLAPL